MTVANETQGLASVPDLLRAIAVSLCVASVVLLTAVLPAEYGLDPTGVGARLGLVRPVSRVVQTPAKAETAATLAPPTEIVGKEADPFRTDDTALTLAPGKGAEIKAVMRGGQGFVFTWTADGPVDFDMHGEATHAARDEFTSYWKDSDQRNGHGAFRAPFDGTHGWYWQNLTTEPVIIRVKTSGYYEKIGRPGH